MEAGVGLDGGWDGVGRRLGKSGTRLEVSEMEVGMGWEGVWGRVGLRLELSEIEIDLRLAWRQEGLGWRLG